MPTKKKNSVFATLPRILAILAALAGLIAALITICHDFKGKNPDLTVPGTVKPTPPKVKKGITSKNSREESLCEGMVYLNNNPLTGAKVEILEARKSTFTEDGKFQIKLFKEEVHETYTLRVSYGEIDSTFTHVKHEDLKNLVFRLRSKENKIYFNVLLLLPSRMSDAEILVDDRPAKIIKRTKIVVTIIVEEKETNHRITVKKGDDSCTKELFIRQDSLRLQPCQ